jgi:hypothetical protein
MRRKEPQRFLEVRGDVGRNRSIRKPCYRLTSTRAQNRSSNHSGIKVAHPGLGEEHNRGLLRPWPGLHGNEFQSQFCSRPRQDDWSHSKAYDMGVNLFDTAEAITLCERGIE